MAEQSKWKPNKWHFYVGLQPGGKPAQDQYHRGTCDSIKKGYLVFAHERQAKVAELDDPWGPLRELKSCCATKFPKEDEKPDHEISPDPSHPTEEPGSEFFVSSKEMGFYHTYRGCEHLAQELGGGNIYGFVKEEDAKTKDVYDRNRPNEYTRGPCFSVALRDEEGHSGKGETCYAKRRK